MARTRAWRPSGRFWSHVVLIVACVVVTFPVIFALIKATQTRSAVLSPSLMPGDQFFVNLRQVWATADLGLFMRNSLIVATAVTVGKTILSLFGGMALVFFRFPGHKFIFGFVLLTLMMPTEVLIVPLFDLVSLRPPASWEVFWAWISDPGQVFLRPLDFGFGWSNSYLALIVPFLASATGTFLFRQHFRAIPTSLADAARIDGATPWQFLSRVLVPMSGNTIGALAVIQFVYVWDQYLWPRVVIRREELQVVQVGLNMIIGAGEGVEWGWVMTGAIVTLIPPMLIFLVLQERFTRGFALTDAK
jgi:sn-glycerol 3-phosphate transport system permease protein